MSRGILHFCAEASKLTFIIRRLLLIDKVSEKKNVFVLLATDEKNSAVS